MRNGRGGVRKIIILQPSLIKTGSGKNRQWMLHLGDIFDDEQDIDTVMKCFPTHCLLGAWSKTVTIEWRNWTAF